jgi:hypothetical protein
MDGDRLAQSVDPNGWFWKVRRGNELKIAKPGDLILQALLQSGS